ncbi:MAG: PAS domain S-box protein [Deltaproteobacteria bacterium]|nr:PAS domain S-box protein [Deltaproteobacteria bacterium]
MSAPTDAGPPPRAPGSTDPARAAPFRELVECCPDFITLHDLDGALLYANPAVARIMGLPMEDRLGIRPLERPEEAGPVMTPAFAAMFQSRLARVAETGEPAAGEAEWPELGGRGPVHHHIRFIPVLGADGRPRAVVAYGRDISDVRAAEHERTRALELLHQRDEEFRALVEHAPDPVLRYDRQARRIYVNPAFERVAGAPAAALLGRMPAEAPVGNEIAGAEAQAAVEAVLRDGAPRMVDLSWCEADGTRRSFQVTYVAERDRSGAVATVLAVARDISALKRSEEELRKLSRALEQSPAAILISDVRGIVEYANPRFQQITGWTKEEAVGQKLRLLDGGEVPAAERQRIWEALRAGREWRGELRSRKKGGEPFWEAVSLSPIYGAEGRITHYLAVQEDVTERRRMEEEYRRSQKMEAFGQLAGGVAHDFNNLLTVIQGNASLLREGAAAEQERQACLAQIAEAAERASRLTRQLLLFSRRQAAQLRDLDLNEVVAEMAKMLRRLIGEHIHLEARLAPTGAPVHADLSMMEQVLMNLAVNARDAMPQGGRLTLETSLVEGGQGSAHPGSWVRLSVSDTGQGIAPEHLAQVFEPFFTTKEVGKGTGLGLATVYGIAEQHGGFVEVRSQPGEGATFEVHLPRLPHPALTAASLAPEVRGGDEVVLLVEDDPGVRRLACNVLRRLGYRVLQAANGIEALEVWARHGPEVALLLTDMVMPGGITGRELAERLHAERPALKVIYSTGYTDDMLGQASALLGTPHVLEKPYGPGELGRRVRACLDEA